MKDGSEMWEPRTGDLRQLTGSLALFPEDPAGAWPTVSAMAETGDVVLVVHVKFLSGDVFSYTPAVVRVAGLEGQWICDWHNLGNCSRLVSRP